MQDPKDTLAAELLEQVVLGRQAEGIMALPAMREFFSSRCRAIACDLMLYDPADESFPSRARENAIRARLLKEMYAHLDDTVRIGADARQQEEIEK